MSKQSMRFHPNPMIRYYCRFALLFIFVVIPLYCMIDAFSYAQKEDIVLQLLAGFVLFMCGCVLLHLGFWEKCFSTLILSDEEICWRCPLRRKRIIPISQCVEIGAYLENANNGIPTEQIYFSDHRYPQKNMTKSGILPGSRHLIKFWYSDDLCRYILKTYPSDKTGRLNAYKQQREKR